MIDIGIDPVTGKRKQKTKSGFTIKKEAVVAPAALIHELEQGIYIEESCQTFADFAKEWLPICSKAKDVKPGTIRVHLHEIGKLLPYFG
ncbi:Arm DNA-binding domain-containing protein [Peribacillus sp. SI8-4]|uniref:Arm DNA-binding domain-containing protein n=1 Tax=Peribacillus sp. SI8-4 TaxID=3048009 RepID=UPI002555279C|nr:Arm DNA-binding domain-containing protein [Peribacillus sp. SI8-4]